MEKFIPKTLDEAIEWSANHLEPEDIEYIESNKDASGIHHTSGMSMRNNWLLWDTKSALNQDIQKRFGLFGHGDDCSGLIFSGLWAKIKGYDVNAALNRTAESYRKHWEKCGLDPKTGEKIKESELDGEYVICCKCHQSVDPIFSGAAMQ